MHSQRRLAALSVSLGMMLVAAVGPARAQDATPSQVPAPPDPNGAPAQAEPAQPEPAQPAPPPPPPADYGTPPGYSPQASPGYPPQPAYPQPAYPPPAYPPPPYGPGPSYPPPGYGQPGGYPPPYNVGSPGNVHDGFFLRLHLGGGFTSVKGNAGTSSGTGSLVAGNGAKISGGSVSLGVALGGALAENLILFGNFFLSVADSPDVTISAGATSSAGLTSSSNGSATLGGFGVGLTYYFMPVNIYLSGALAAMIFEMDDNEGNKVFASDAGLGFQGMVGKEWWVSPEWGLGVAGELTVASMKDKDNGSITWTGSSFSLVFSSTFN